MLESGEDVPSCLVYHSGMRMYHHVWCINTRTGDFESPSLVAISRIRYATYLPETPLWLLITMDYGRSLSM